VHLTVFLERLDFPFTFFFDANYKMDRKAFMEHWSKKKLGSKKYEFELKKQISRQFPDKNTQKIKEWLTNTENILNQSDVKKDSVSGWVYTDINDKLINVIKVNLQYSNIVESETRVNWKRFKELFTEAHMKMMAELKENLEDMIDEYDSREMERLEFTQEDLKTIKNKLNNLKTFKGFDSDRTGARQVLENVIAKAQTTYDKRLQDQRKKEEDLRRDRKTDAEEAVRNMKFAEASRSGKEKVPYDKRRSTKEIPMQGITKRRRQSHSRVVVSSDSDD